MSKSERHSFRSARGDSSLYSLSFQASSLSHIVSGGDGLSREGGARGKSVSKPFPPTFWDDANAAVLKVHEALLVDDLNPLMSKLSNDVMPSHI